MPLKSTDEGFEYGEEGDLRLNGKRRVSSPSNNPFLKDRTVRDVYNRPLRWNQAIGDFEVDIDKWIEEANGNST